MHTVRRDGGESGLVLLFKQTTRGCALGLYITILEFSFLRSWEMRIRVGQLSLFALPLGVFFFFRFSFGCRPSFGEIIKLQWNNLH